MFVYNAVTAICFAMLTLTVIYLIVNFCIKNRRDRIAYLRSFKKGKCAVVFVFALPLFCIGYMYGGTDFFTALFKSVGNTINLVVLKYSLSDISALMEANVFFRITVDYCCVLVLLNAALFTLSLTSQYIRSFICSVQLKVTSKPWLCIFGHNANSLSVYKSASGYAPFVVDKLSADDKYALYCKKMSYKSCASDEGVISAAVARVIKKHRACTVIINTENDEKNLDICRRFITAIQRADENGRNALFAGLRIYVFGDPKYEAVYEQTVGNSYGCIHYKNKYRMIAVRFIDKYPVSAFMDERHIDYSTSLLKKDTEINICLIGFGNANRQIFLTSVANNQFLTEGKHGPVVKKIKYAVFDKNPSEENKNLNHTYYRFKNEFADADPAEYLPLPEQPAVEEYHRLDINSPDFYGDVKKCVSAKNGVAFVIISFGSDLENIDLAQKLAEKRREWELDELVIFVKVRQSALCGALSEEKNCYVIGDESADVYDVNEITSDKIFRMAQMRNEVYELESKMTADRTFVPDENAVRENRAASIKGWYLEKCQWERESSLYCCLSLRSKLNLLGLDYCRADENTLVPLSESEYMNRYAADDMPDTQSYNLTVEGKRVIKYTLSFPQSARKNLAYLEHIRWNAFMLSKGIVPADRQHILGEKVLKKGKSVYSNGKNYALRRHGNLTTFEGLEEFAKMTAARDGVSEEEKDVIKYDYQIMDDAYWLLTANGFKIVDINPRRI